MLWIIVGDVSKSFRQRNYRRAVQLHRNTMTLCTYYYNIIVRTSKIHLKMCFIRIYYNFVKKKNPDPFQKNSNVHTPS